MGSMVSVQLSVPFLPDFYSISGKASTYKRTADNLITLIKEIEFIGVELPAHLQAQIVMLSTTIEKGKELTDKVTSSSQWRSWTLLQQLTFAKRMKKLEKEAPILTQILDDVYRLMPKSDMRFDLVSKRLEEMRVEMASMENMGGWRVRDPLMLTEATMEIESNNTEESGKGLKLGKVVIEEWEFQYGRLRFSYEELSIATKGFKENKLLGKGGFGQVYKGKLPGSDAKIAVKQTSHHSRQGMREFLAEITTIGCLKHPNLVRLLGYCKHKEELFLVYDYMPNGSLDKYMSRNENQQRLTWEQRFKIIKDIASALLYMHREWKQVIIHRDIKPANVLIDHEMNARLGDFGLAKLYDHGFDPHTSKVAGTFGYIAPEFVTTRRASTRTDVYAFGVVMLEVVCGRRLFEECAEESEELLTDWILDLWEKGNVIDAAEESIRQEENKEQIELVLKLGVSCSHQNVSNRPNMSMVIEVLNGDSELPDSLLDVLRREKFKERPKISPMGMLFDLDSLGTSTSDTESFYSCI